MWSLTFRGLTTDVEVVVTDAESPAVALVAELFASWHPAQAPATLRYRLSCSPSLRVSRNGEWIGTGKEEIDLVPLFELDLYQQLIGGAADRWIVHGGALSLDGRGLVLAGESGAGKSTTTIAAVARGAGYLTDEYVAVGPDRELVGMRRAIAFDDGPAELVPGDFVRVLYPIRMASGRIVNELYRPPSGRMCERAPLSALILVSYDPSSESGWREIGSSDALERLWACTMNPGQRALEIATAMLSAVPVRELVTNDLQSACERLADFAQSL